MVIVRFWFKCLNVFALITQLIKVCSNLRAAKNIVLYPHGGFGHTLIAPDWIRRLYPDEVNVVLFGTWEGRHNKSVPLIWKGTLIMVPMSNFCPGIGLIADSEWSETLFQAVGTAMQFLWPEKRIIYFVYDMMDLSTRPDFISKDKFFASRMELYYYHLVVMREASKPELPQNIRSSISETILRVRPQNMPFSCNLYLRSKGQNVNDLSDIRRNSSSIDKYLQTLRHLNAQGYQVLITGDIELPQHLRDEFSGAVIDWRDVEVSKDLYHLFAGLYTDILIGGLSGGSAYTHIADIPSLIVDGFSFGEAFPFSTVHYKRLRAADGTMVTPQDLMTKFFFDYDCEGYEIIDNTSEEILCAVRDWLPHAKSRKSWGIDPKALGVPCPWLNVSQARLSPTWLEGFK